MKKTITASLVAITTVLALSAAVPTLAQQSGNAYQRAVDNNKRAAEPIRARQAEEVRRHNDRVDNPTRPSSGHTPGVGEMKDVPCPAKSNRNGKGAQIGD